MHALASATASSILFKYDKGWEAQGVYDSWIAHYLPSKAQWPDEASFDQGFCFFGNDAIT